MNEMALFGDKRMTVKEVAEALGVSDRVVQLSIKRLCPEAVANGKTTWLDEAQVTAIKQDLQGHHNLEGTFEAVHTDLEMARKAQEVMAWMAGKVSSLEAQLAEAQPKVESFNALMRSERTMSITQAAKHFGLHPKSEVFPYLRDRGYLTSRDLPTQAALDAGYLALREAECSDSEIRPQAVGLASQLETWRTRVVPQIAAWKALI